MAKQLTSEQLSEIYIKLPEHIKELASSQETTNIILKICEEIGIGDQRVGIISDLIRDVIFGLSPKEEFEINLEKEAQLPRGIAVDISQKAENLFFSKMVQSQTANQPQEQSSLQGDSQIADTGENDTYRESVE
jgi:hypothetical protein